jgi:hypothetical protein
LVNPMKLPAETVISEDKLVRYLLVPSSEEINRRFYAKLAMSWVTPLLSYVTCAIRFCRSMQRPLRETSLASTTKLGEH